ncbi:hypothetical protein [Pontibacter beigongshangensis]|uniref:hypothetical protein n=1 Tax=Pontibacter beigongshangensis TaxID=2574733 RepID=UPI00164FECC2|nr:hypothetical protein [Pontibacter beigongshangensis]
MQQLRSYIALFLLLLFVRPMVPDGLLLSLHSHEHTSHEVPCDTHQAQVDKKHIHCDVEDLFGAPFQPAVAAIDFLFITHTAVYTVPQVESLHRIPVSYAYLRGPPLG